MLHGLPGTGKSTLAKQISEQIPNSVVLKTVNFRKTKQEGISRFDETNEQTKKEKDASYQEMIKNAKETLEQGKTPILDATFHKKYRREWVQNLAKEMNAELKIITVTCDEKTIKERIQQRTKDNEDMFLDTFEAYKIMKEQQDELEEYSERVDTGEMWG